MVRTQGLTLVAALAVAGSACHLAGGLGDLEFSDAAGGSSATGTATTTSTAGAGGTAGSTAAGGAGASGGAGGAGGAAPPPCHPAGLTDDFSSESIDDSLWSIGASAEVTVGAAGGVAFFEPQPNQTSSSYGWLRSAATYDFTGCGVWIELLAPLSPGVPGWAELTIYQDGSNEAEIQVHGDGSIRFTLETNDSHVPDEVSIPYAPAEHRWLRLREEGGTLYEETSPDAVNWTTRFTNDAPAWLASARMRFGIYTSTTPASPGRVQFDHANLLP